MVDILLAELVNTAMAERSREAESNRVAAEVGRENRAPRLRPRVALALVALAARIHPEAARLAVGQNGASGRHGWLCLCED